MKRFIPKEKMSKKARKELDRQRRVFWPLCPVTRVQESDKRLCRKADPRAFGLDDEI